MSVYYLVEYLFPTKQYCRWCNEAKIRQSQSKYIREYATNKDDKCLLLQKNKGGCGKCSVWIQSLPPARRHGLKTKDFHH
mmetsp:Transcript_29756/g.63101  ORF Transcript_29756/g.63101 Transcript_29756/m.63101 type:complete len:80 (-) Transcript_29756:80-319(-)